MTEIDDSKVMKTLANLQKRIDGQQHKRAFARSARKGGNFLKSKVKAMIPNSDRFPFVSQIKRAVVVKNSKTFRKYPGVNVTVKKTEAPVSPGKGRSWWDVRGYAFLVFFGNYKSPGRSGRGDVKGITPRNVFETVEDHNGTQALKLVADHFIIEVKKEIDKSIVQ